MRFEFHSSGRSSETKMRRLSGLDAAFSAAEGPVNYVMHTMVLGCPSFSRWSRSSP